MTIRNRSIEDFPLRVKMCG